MHRLQNMAEFGACLHYFITLNGETGAMAIAQTAQKVFSIPFPNGAIDLDPPQDYEEFWSIRVEAINQETGTEGDCLSSATQPKTIANNLQEKRKDYVSNTV